ncbi:MAG: NAD-dependent epimerase/dehydratase family protein [Clostridiales bacterium]|nr:NAD-dependent epimerase/dehydratase family protein [Clostridiales bacterium]
MIISITGITGNMGQATLDALHNAPHVDKIKLLSHSPKRTKKLLKKHKKLLNKIEIVEGGVNDEAAVMKLIAEADLVINMAAVIPPRSDKNPKAAIACNEHGVNVLVDCIQKATPQPALVHISTVALYGNRSGGHPFGRVGDPLMPAPLDVYSATKLRGEFTVLESDIQKWAVLRQTAMLHPQMLTDNIHDGLMFHTTFDAPLEWATAHDSGVLIANIAEGFACGTIPESFWLKCYNISGGKVNRSYGIDTFDDGFAVIGGNSKKFFKPGYNAARNFHGVWYLDGDELNDLFHFQSQTTTDYWRKVFNAHPYFKLGKLAPNGLIKKFLFGKLLRDDNAPSYWAKHGDEARIIAAFGSREKYDALQKATWKDFPVPDRKKIAEMTDNETPLFYGFDFFKPNAELTQADLESVAKAHGGELLSAFNGDMYQKLEWRTQDGESFSARPYTVLRAGHWYNPLYKEFVWDFDRLAKKDEIYASLWYDTHEKDEDIRYSLDENFCAYATRINE